MSVSITISDQLTESQAEQVHSLWNAVYPVSLKDRFSLLLRDVEVYEHHLMLDDKMDIVGWAMTFLRDEETWFSILISPAHQKKGFGSMMLENLKRNFDSLCGWVIDHNDEKKLNGEYYVTPLPFYLKAGFKVLNDQRIDSSVISAVKMKFEH